MERGSVVVAVFPRDFGKPRPVVVVQANVFNRLDSVTLLPLTSDLRAEAPFRLHILPMPANGLTQPCQVMIDKAQTVYVDKIGRSIGRLDKASQVRVDAALALFLGLA